MRLLRKIKNRYYKVKRFIINIFKYRKELSRVYPWDYSGTLILIKRSLEISYEAIKENSFEINDSKLKKLSKMNRAIQILDNILGDNYFYLAEKSLNIKLIHKKFNFIPINESNEYFTLQDNLSEEERNHNRKIYNESDKIQEREWRELFEILKGQDSNILKRNYDKLYNGSGLRGWWY